MQKSDISVGALVSMIGRGELKLPEMQRQYVWRASRVRDLLDSLYRGYPSGSILVWETTNGVPVRDPAVQQSQSPFSGSRLLLDGQQRLTSLAAVMTGTPVTVRGRKKPVEILFNLDHPAGAPQEVTEVEGDQESAIEEEEESDNDGELDRGTIDNSLDPQARFKSRTFVVANKRLERQPEWISASIVFRGEDSDVAILKGRGIDTSHPNFEKYFQRLQALRKIKDYQYVMHVLGPEYSYREVAEIFVRVNSLGVKLRASDLALAQITSRWRGCLRLFEDFQDEYEELFPVDLSLLLRTMVVFATRQSSFDTVANVGVRRLQSGWEDAKKALSFAIDFLRADAGIEDPSLLSSPLLLIPVAVFGQLKQERLALADRQALLYWFHVANARGHFTRGSTETVLDTDLRIIFRGGSPADLLGPLETQIGRLTIDAADLVGRGINNPLFSTMYVALKAQGARDWQTGLTISLGHKGKSRFIEHHHIFPRSLLARAGHDRTAINELANLAFISSGTNLRLTNKEPASYFPEIVRRQGAEVLTKQAIPADPALYRLDAFPEFLEVRRALLADQINAFLESTRTGSIPERALDVAELIQQGESKTVEFKSSLQWDTKEARPNPALRMSVLKTITAFLNSNGGTLLIGVNPNGAILGLAEDLHMTKESRDEFEQTLVNLIVRYLGAASAGLARITFCAVEDKLICAVQVRPAPAPVYAEDGSARIMYVRAGNTTRPLDTKDAVEYIRAHWKGR